MILVPGFAGGRPAGDGLGRIFLALAMLWTLTMPLSIAVAESALWAAAIVGAVWWLTRELRGDDAGVEPGRGPAGDIFSLVGAPLMAFWGVSVVAALASRDPVAALWELREVFLFAAPVVAYVAYRHPRLRRLGLLVFGAGVATAIAIGLVGTWLASQRGEFPGSYRPDGTLSHYMTYAGALMLAVPALLIVREGIAGVLHRLVAIGAVVVIGLTMTRSAWIGCFAGALVYGLCRLVPGRQPRRGPPARRWAVWGVALLVALVLGATVLLSLAGPEALYARGASIFSLENPTNRDRLAMAATGLRIVRAHPLLGVGPGLVERVYPAWRVEWAVKENNPHLHNDLLQIAAERGLLGLAAWLWLMAALGVGAWRVLRHAGPFGEGGPEARAAMAAMAAFVVMGLFEYNFSDSEVLMIFLYVTALPFAASAGIVLGAGTAAEQERARLPRA